MNQQYVCPLVNARFQYDDDNDAMAVVLEPCAQEVHLVYESYVPLDNTQSPTELENATYWAWSAKCVGGHVLATSYDEDGNGNPAPFTWELLP